MKIGIIVYSQTENTHLVALRLKEKLVEVGHDVEVERVIPVGDVPPQAKNVEFENIPDVDKYEAIIFGSPVHAFNLAPAMNAYLGRVPSLENKKIACYVTKGLPFNWTGGNRAVGKMKKISESKGGTVVGTDIIVWRGDIEKKIEELIRTFSLLF